MKKSFQILAGFVLLMLVGCSANNATEVPTLTNTPLPTQTSTITPTNTPKPTRTPIPTPEPIFITIGSPFPPEWGTPRIWSDDSFNWLFDATKFDNTHGHVDILVPLGFAVEEGFNIEEHIGDVIAPVGGLVKPYPDGSGGLHIFLPENTYIAGILDALNFSGVQNPSLRKIHEITIHIGHVKNIKLGNFNKGDVIAEIDPFYFCPTCTPQTKIGFQVTFTYDGVGDLMFSPTLFELDSPWECYVGSPYDCEPEPGDYAK